MCYVRERERERERGERENERGGGRERENVFQLCGCDHTPFSLYPGQAVCGRILCMSVLKG